MMGVSWVFFGLGMKRSSTPASSKSWDWNNNYCLVHQVIVNKKPHTAGLGKILQLMFSAYVITKVHEL